jgi:hypothetical protein
MCTSLLRHASSLAATTNVAADDATVAAISIVPYTASITPASNVAGNITTSTTTNNAAYDNANASTDTTVPLSVSTIGLRHQRGKGFQAIEDTQLCRSWLAVSQDPVTGADQKGTTFWDRIYEDFCHHKESGEERSAKALKCRWTVIQTAVNKFSGAYAQIDAQNQSGITPDTKVCPIFYFHSDYN